MRNQSNQNNYSNHYSNINNQESCSKYLRSAKFLLIFGYCHIVKCTTTSFVHYVYCLHLICIILQKYRFIVLHYAHHFLKLHTYLSLS